jgi:hypothetical protein
MHDRGLHLIEPIPRERCIPALEHRQQQAWIERTNAAAAAAAATANAANGRAVVGEEEEDVF